MNRAKLRSLFTKCSDLVAKVTFKIVSTVQPEEFQVKSPMLSLCRE